MLFASLMPICEHRRMATKTKRHIEQADKLAAERLRRLWKDYKAIHAGISQDIAGDRIGLSQAVFSQYLLCKIPLGAAATLKFAKLFGVAPSAIRPDLDYPGNDQANLRAEQASLPYEANGALSKEAIEIATAWDTLPPDTKKAIRDRVFLEAIVAKHYPWLRATAHHRESYREFEARVERDIARKAKRRTTA